MFDQFGHVIAILVKMLFEQKFYNSVFVLTNNTSYFARNYKMFFALVDGFLYLKLYSLLSDMCRCQKRVCVL